MSGDQQNPDPGSSGWESHRLLILHLLEACDHQIKETQGTQRKIADRLAAVETRVDGHHEHLADLERKSNAIPASLDAKAAIDDLFDRVNSLEHPPALPRPEPKDHFWQFVTENKWGTVLALLCLLLALIIVFNLLFPGAFIDPNNLVGRD